MQARIITHYLSIGVVALWLGGVMVGLGLILMGIVQHSWLMDAQR